MKLANALSLRSELQTRIRQLESRLDNNALVQEGESPAEDPMELLRELEEDYAQLEELIARINRTNSTTEAVSYTHLDVYKRQALIWALPARAVNSMVASSLAPPPPFHGMAATVTSRLL